MVLYVLMGIAMGRVWCRVEPAKPDAPWSIYSAQPAFNGLWSIAFFSISVPYVSLVVILFLLVAVILCTRAFAKVDRTAGWLMVPYLLWVSFARLFNASLVFFTMPIDQTAPLSTAFRTLPYFFSKAFAVS